MKLIPLTQGKFAKVDDADYECLSQWKWMVTHYGYACRFLQKDKKKRVIWMHRVINNTPDGMLTDHVNHDTLDNRRENLRTATHAYNNHNSRKRVDGVTSSYKGVYWFNPANLWVSRFK